MKRNPSTLEGEKQKFPAPGSQPWGWGSILHLSPVMVTGNLQLWGCRGPPAVKFSSRLCMEPSHPFAPLGQAGPSEQGSTEDHLTWVLVNTWGCTSGCQLQAPLLLCDFFLYSANHFFNLNTTKHFLSSQVTKQADFVLPDVWMPRYIVFALYSISYSKSEKLQQNYWPQA